MADNTAKNITKINPAAEWEFDLTGLKVQEYRDIMAISLVDRAAYEKGLPYLCKRIKKWPFAGDPGEPESYGDLDFFDEWQQLIKQLSAAILERSKK
jgi:hypothetical protein